ncbi:MAG TPA: hypothetical protein VK502_00550, partial [Candidatus Saccharimonadales bacterium]|nr:hypothetical protein [Candidatus Saccharimonadales bacterium]
MNLLVTAAAVLVFGVLVFPLRRLQKAEKAKQNFKRAQEVIDWLESPDFRNMSLNNQGQNIAMMYSAKWVPNYLPVGLSSDEIIEYLVATVTLYRLNHPEAKPGKITVISGIREAMPRER